jgi:hypothetical protein
MIIVYPYRVSCLVLTYNGVSKRPVDSNIMLPAVLLPNFEFGIIWNLIMKCWPNDLFAISVVMALEIGIRDKYRVRSLVLNEIICDFGLLVLA